MHLYTLAVALVIFSSVFYHLVQKATPHGVNPLLSLSITYFVALLASLSLLPFFLTQPLKESLHQLNWTSFALAFAIIGLELGALLAYRAGWNISFLAIFSNVAVTLLLIPLGLLLFGEQLTVMKAIGILSCIGGLLMIHLG